MEQSFNHDFSDVRINDDKESAELCASLNAQAFAIGNDIFFNTGKFNPESSQGKELLAHELTHVVQQGITNSGIIQRQPAETVPVSSDSHISVANRSVIQRSEDKDAGEKNPHDGKAGRWKELVVLIRWRLKKSISQVQIQRNQDLRLKIPKEERDNKQIEKWEAGILKDYGSDIDTKVKDLIAKTTPIGEK